MGQQARKGHPQHDDFRAFNQVRDGAAGGEVWAAQSDEACLWSVAWISAHELIAAGSCVLLWDVRAPPAAGYYYTIILHYCMTILYYYTTTLLYDCTRLLHYFNNILRASPAAGYAPCTTL